MLASEKWGFSAFVQHVTGKQISVGLCIVDGKTLQWAFLDQITTQYRKLLKV